MQQKQVIKVAILGATGETGSSIINALVESTDVLFVSHTLSTAVQF